MTKTLLAAVAVLALAAPAFAQAPAAPATTAMKTTTTVKTAVTKTAVATKTKGPATTAAKTPEGKACSTQADAQGLHGKARQAFRSKCKAAAKPAAPTSTSPMKK